MSPDEFKAFRPCNEDEIMAYEEEGKFRDWCDQNEEDPRNPGTRGNYNEIQQELGDKFWDNLDEDNRAGWEDNLNKG